MSTNIGTNFSYNGARYLDDRQGQAKTPADLKNWRTLIPVGFKVWLDGSWYIYDPSLPENPLTGKFHKIFADELIDSTSMGVSAKVVKDSIQKLYDYIDDLESRIFPLELEYISKNEVLYTGSEVTPEIIWKVTRGGKEIIPGEVTINGDTSGVNLKENKWISPTPITENQVYDVVIKKCAGKVEARVSYTFSNPRYWGVSEYPTLTGERIQGLQNSDWGLNNIITQTSVNCSGGKYIWTAIPSEIWNNNPKTNLWVSGIMLSSDVETLRVLVTNPYNQEIEYTCLRLNNIQTGSDLVIELK